MEATTTEQVQDLGTLGQIDESLFAGAEEILGMEEYPILMPNKEGFLVGQTVGGIYRGTEAVYTNKMKTANKIEASTGRKYRNKIVLDGANGVRFGIWETGQLESKLKKVNIGDAVAITLVGTVDTPKGKAYDFTVRVKRNSVATATALS